MEVGEQVRDLLLVHPAHRAGKQPQVVAPGEEPVQSRLLQRGAEQAGSPGVLGPAVVASDPGHAAVRVLEAQKDADGRGLAGPVRAQKTEHLALGDAERDLVQGAHAPISFGDPLHLDQR